MATLTSPPPCFIEYINLPAVPSSCTTCPGLADSNHVLPQECPSSAHRGGPHRSVQGFQHRTQWDNSNPRGGQGIWEVVEDEASNACRKRTSDTTRKLLSTASHPGPSIPVSASSTAVIVSTSTETHTHKINNQYREDRPKTCMPLPRNLEWKEVLLCI